MKAEQAFQQALSLSKKFTADTMQGAGAIKGDPGENGISPTVSVTNISGGHKVTITDANGTNGFDVMDGNADIAGGTIGMFILSKDVNIQKDSVLNVSKSQIVGHTPIKYPGQMYDIYAGIIWQGNEIYFTTFIIQNETGNSNQYYEIKLMGEPKKLTGGIGTSYLVFNATFDDTPQANMAYEMQGAWFNRIPIDGEKSSGIITVDNITYYATGHVVVSGWTYVLETKKVTKLTGEDGSISSDISPYLLCYSAYPATVEIANGIEKSIIAQYFVGAVPTTNANGMMIYGHGDNHYLIRFKVLSADSEVVDVQFASDPVQINTPDMTQYYNKSQVDEKIAEISTIPTGVIVIWSGTADNVPIGWHICDGTDGTPDLTDKFVLGAGTTHIVGSIGGEEEHTLTVNEIPAHSHQQRAAMDATHTAVTAIGDTAGSKKVNSIKTDVVEVDTYSPLTTISVGEGQPHNNMPPYYTLCYIMKVS